ITDLYNNALARLEFGYPTTLAAFNAVCEPRSLIDDAPDALYQLVDIAVELGLHTLLPSMLYAIVSEFEPIALFDGIETRFHVAR
ncbi:hypothetical protein CVT24_003216, partial [Panaeolus cyanescens]